MKSKDLTQTTSSYDNVRNIAAIRSNLIAFEIPLAVANRFNFTQIVLTLYSLRVSPSLARSISFDIRRGFSLFILYLCRLKWFMFYRLLF